MMRFLLVPTFLTFIAVPHRPAHAESPKLPTTRQTTIEDALRKLAAPCPQRYHINELVSNDEGRRFVYRPQDMYEDCADERDALVKTREPVDDRLIQMAGKSTNLAERYRIARVLSLRRNEKALPILEKMAGSNSAEERYLAWSAYEDAVRGRYLAAPRSFDVALAHCKNEPNRHVRALIMGFLGTCRAKAAVPLLMAALDHDPEYGAVLALGEIRDRKTAPAILARARKETQNRHIYFFVLGRIGTPDAVDYLLGCLDEGCFAVEALFESGSPKALPAIEKQLARIKAKEKPDELDLAVAQVSVLCLKHADPREHLLALAMDRKQSTWMQTKALEALGHYDKEPLAGRLLKLYRAEADDWTRMIYIRLLRDLPGHDITESLIDQALTDRRNEYYFSHADLLVALNERLGTSFRTLELLAEHLQRVRASKDR